MFQKKKKKEKMFQKIPEYSRTFWNVFFGVFISNILHFEIALKMEHFIVWILTLTFKKSQSWFENKKLNFLDQYRPSESNSNYKKKINASYS